MAAADPQTLAEVRHLAAIKPWPTTGRLMSLGKNATYQGIARGEIPSIRVGGAIRVPIPALLRLLGEE